MATNKQAAPWISETLTWAQICARYPDEWVCLVELEYAKNDVEILRGRVIGHGKTRGEPVEQALLWRDHYKLIGHYYTGRITERPPIRPRLVLDDETRAFFFPRR